MSVFVLIFFIFKPTSTKPHAGRLGWTYRVMVATAVYSVTVVLRKEVSLSLLKCFCGVAAIH